ncbi:hypothetical protein BDQ12DRAFT_378524 [Crucibulum laeve]|uniref:Uncharacterized protein n=1 Tax=Crucibulum laeve TaxID=68775 RepID=A0A5C3LN37_9AGAR|nr:hypothetical protein BDQ12DRAFT_378524 [Crucibulum laeve]
MHVEMKIIELKRRLKSERRRRWAAEQKFSRFETVLKAEFNPDSSRASFQRTRSPSLEIMELRSNSIIIEDDGDSDIEVIHPETPVPTTTTLPPYGEISPSTSVADREYEAYDLEWLKRRCAEAATNDRGMQDMTHGSNPSGSDASNGANAITTPRTSASVTIEPEERRLKREESLMLSVPPFEDTFAEGHTLLEYIGDLYNEDSPLPEEISADDMKIGRRGSVQGSTTFELPVPSAPTFARPETPFNLLNNSQAACSLPQIPPTPPSTINPMRLHTASTKQDEEGILIDKTNLNKRKRKSNVKSLQTLTKEVKSTSNASAGIVKTSISVFMPDD